MTSPTSDVPNRPLAAEPGPLPSRPGPAVGASGVGAAALLVLWHRVEGTLAPTPPPAAARPSTAPRAWAT